MRQSKAIYSIFSILLGFSILLFPTIKDSYATEQNSLGPADIQAINTDNKKRIDSAVKKIDKQRRFLLLSAIANGAVGAYMLNKQCNPTPYPKGSPEENNPKKSLNESEMAEVSQTADGTPAADATTATDATPAADATAGATDATAGATDATAGATDATAGATDATTAAETVTSTDPSSGLTRNPNTGATPWDQPMNSSAGKVPTYSQPSPHVTAAPATPSSGLDAAGHISAPAPQTTTLPQGYGPGGATATPQMSASLPGAPAPAGPVSPGVPGTPSPGFGPGGGIAQPATGSLAANPTTSFQGAAAGSGNAAGAQITTGPTLPGNQMVGGLGGTPPTTPGVGGFSGPPPAAGTLPPANVAPGAGNLANTQPVSGGAISAAQQNAAKAAASTTAGAANPAAAAKIQAPFTGNPSTTVGIKSAVGTPGGAAAIKTKTVIIKGTKVTVPIK